jgi:hypothetical protein
VGSLEHKRRRTCCGYMVDRRRQVSHSRKVLGQSAEQILKELANGRGGR